MKMNKTRTVADVAERLAHNEMFGTLCFNLGNAALLDRFHSDRFGKHDFLYWPTDDQSGDDFTPCAKLVIRNVHDVGAKHFRLEGTPTQRAREIQRLLFENRELQ